MGNSVMSPIWLGGAPPPPRGYTPPQMGSHLGGAWQGMPWQGLPQLQNDPMARQWTGLPPIDPSQHIAMQSPGGGGGGGYSGFGGHHPNSYNPGGHISSGIASGSYNMPDDAHPPIPPGYPAPGNGPIVAQGASWVGSTHPPTPSGSPPPLPQRAPPSAPNLAAPGYSFGATPGMVGTSADAWNQSDKPHVSEGYGPSAHAWTPRAATGGHFMPGQSAIVGDRPNGKPGPNAEVVTAMPGGGFVVTPNAKNMPPLPRFADGSGGVFGGDTFGVPSPLNNHTGSPFINGVNNVANTIALPFSAHYAVGQELAGDSSYANTPPPSFAVPHPVPSKRVSDFQIEPGIQPPPIRAASPIMPPTRQIGSHPPPPPNQDFIAKQQAIIDASKTHMDAYNPLKGAVHFFSNNQGTGIWDGSSHYASAIGDAAQSVASHVLGGQTSNDFLNEQNARAKIANAKRTGHTSDWVPPAADSGSFVSPGEGNLLAKQSLPYLDENNDTVSTALKGSFDNVTGPVARQAPSVATPEPAWSPQQLNAYALRQQTNERLGLKQGDNGWIDPNEAAKQMGATPQPEGPMLAAVDPTARANSILQGWQAAKMPEGPPPGLSPLAGRAWQEQRARMANTREGRAQILNTELARLGIDRQFGREVALHDRESQNTYFNQQALQDRKDWRGMTMAQKHQEWLQKQEQSKNTPSFIPKPLPGSNTAMMVGGKEVRPDKAPPHPMGFVPDEHMPGIGVYHDGKGGATPGHFDEQGQFHKLGEKPTAEKIDKPEKPHNFGGMTADGVKKDDWRERGPDGRWYPVQMSDAQPTSTAGIKVTKL